MPAPEPKNFSIPWYASWPAILIGLPLLGIGVILWIIRVWIVREQHRVYARTVLAGAIPFCVIGVPLLISRLADPTHSGLGMSVFELIFGVICLLQAFAAFSRAARRDAIYDLVMMKRMRVAAEIARELGNAELLAVRVEIQKMGFAGLFPGLVFDPSEGLLRERVVGEREGEPPAVLVTVDFTCPGCGAANHMRVPEGNDITCEYCGKAAPDDAKITP